MTKEKRLVDMIGIGTIIGGFEVYGVCGEYCVARSMSPEIAELYIVYKVDSMNLFHVDKYFTNKEDAEREFARRVFEWFK